MKENKQLGIRSGKKIEQSIKLCEYIDKLEEGKMHGIKKIGKSGLLIREDEVIPKSIIEKEKENLEQQYQKELEKNSVEAFILKCQLEVLEKILEVKE